MMIGTKQPNSVGEITYLVDSFIGYRVLFTLLNKQPPTNYQTIKVLMVIVVIYFVKQ